MYIFNLNFIYQTGTARMLFITLCACTNRFRYLEVSYGDIPVHLPAKYWCHWIHTRSEKMRLFHLVPVNNYRGGIGLGGRVIKKDQCIQSLLMNMVLVFLN